MAVRDDEVIGHILFSPAAIEYQGRTIAGAALGPMAVLPRYQRQGIGTKLVKDGVSRLQEKSCPFLVVIGHPEYYPRFGFRPASKFGVQSDWDVPDEAFMMMVLADEEMQGVKEQSSTGRNSHRSDNQRISKVLRPFLHAPRFPGS